MELYTPWLFDAGKSGYEALHESMIFYEKENRWVRSSTALQHYNEYLEYLRLHTAEYVHRMWPGKYRRS